MDSRRPMRQRRHVWHTRIHRWTAEDRCGREGTFGIRGFTDGQQKTDAAEKARLAYEDSQMVSRRPMRQRRHVWHTRIHRWSAEDRCGREGTFGIRGFTDGQQKTDAAEKARLA